MEKYTISSHPVKTAYPTLRGRTRSSGPSSFRSCPTGEQKLWASSGGPLRVTDEHSGGSTGLRSRLCYGRVLEQAGRRGFRVENVPIAVAIVFGVLFVILAIALAVGGLALVQYLVPWQVRQRHNDVAGFIYAVLGVVYAVLLGFVTIAVWEDFEMARGTAESEANELAELFWLAHEFPEPEGERLEELARSYAEVVIDEEWPLMEQGRSSPRAWALTEEMRSSIYDFDPDTGTERVLYDRGLMLVHDLVDQRRLRLLEAEAGIPRVLWVVLVVGGIIVVGFGYLFGLENTRSHRLIIAALAAMIAPVTSTIYALDHPFAGLTQIQPHALELVLERFEQD